MNPSRLLAIMAVALAAAPAASSAQSLAELMKQTLVDMPVTTAPASFLLGAGGEAVPRLTSFRDVALHLGRGMDAQGRIAQSVGVEVVPAFAVGSMSWAQINANPLSKAWSRTAVSVATDAGNAEQGGRGALGVQTLLYAPALDAALRTFADPACGSAYQDLLNTPPVDPGPEVIVVDMSAKDKKLIEACGERVQDILTQWNQPLVSIGAGRSFAARSSSSAASPPGGSALWLTAAFGADLKAADPAKAAPAKSGLLLTTHLRWSTQVPVEDAAGQQVYARQRLIGANLRYGGPRLAFIAELSHTRSRATGHELPDRRRSLLGMEFQLDRTSDLFFTVGLARDSGADTAHQALLAKVNWGFGSKASLR